jgi:hypothetical protein
MIGEFLREDRVKECATCHRPYTSGDVATGFQASILAVAYLCGDCAIAALEAGHRPTHCLVFLEAKYAGMELDDLPLGIRLRVIEGFGIVDTIQRGLLESTRGAGGVKS